MLGYDGELTLRNYHDSKGGTSDSVTAKGNLKSLRSRWQTAAVSKKICPASVYAAESYRVSSSPRARPATPPYASPACARCRTMTRSPSR